MNCLTEELKKIKTDVEISQMDNDKSLVVTLKPQRKYPIQTKKKVVHIAKKFGAARVSISTDIPESSISRWIRISGSGRKPRYTELEEELLNYFVDCRRNGVQINNNSLLKQARIVADSKGFADFIGSLSWLSGFKWRRLIVYRRRTRMGQRLRQTAEQDLESFQKQIFDFIDQHKYPLEAIINIDEPGICFDMPSNYTLEFQVT